MEVIQSPEGDGFTTRGYREETFAKCHYHDSHAHDYKWSGVLTWLVGFVMVWIGYVWMVNRSGQLW
jgi:uncharacterized membrane protein